MQKFGSVAALSLAALIVAGPLGGVHAQEAGTVLKGADAFGGWEQDKPGVKRLIKADDLEAADLTKASSNGAKPSKREDGALPEVPDSFKVELVAEGITEPRAMAFAPNGDLFVSNSSDGEVLVFHFDGDGAKPASKSVYVDELNQPYGIAFYPADKPEWVYVAESDGLKRYRYNEGDLKAPEGDGVNRGETILEGIPAEHHWTRDVVFSADGKTMFYSIGSGSNVGDGTMEREPEGGVEAWAANHPLGAAWGDEEGRAEVRAFDPDGTNERVFATGLRNCAGMTLQPQTGDLWCAVNERDQIGDNVPFEYVTTVKDGGFYGWPWYYNGGNLDPRWSEEPREDLADKVTVGDVLMQAHSAPLDLAFYTGDKWGPEYKGAAFATLHGSWNRGTRTGYKIVKLEIGADGKPTGAYEDFVTGFVQSNDKLWGRLVGVAVSPDGALFFSEDGSGTIWKVTKD